MSSRTPWIRIRIGCAISRKILVREMICRQRLTRWRHTLIFRADLTSLSQAQLYELNQVSVRFPFYGIASMLRRRGGGVFRTSSTAPSHPRAR
jgi:hypothetical protein